jgi:hypothetical protein
LEAYVVRVPYLNSRPMAGWKVTVTEANEQGGRAFGSLGCILAASRGSLGHARLVRAALILLVAVLFAASWISAPTSEIVEAYRPSGVIGVFPPNGRGANLACPEPTATPTLEPTATPTLEPTATPTPEPTATPTLEPTATPTLEPMATPTLEPTATPTLEPTATPTLEPTATPTLEPTAAPTLEPTATAGPAVEPTSTLVPTPRPTRRPTRSPEPALIVVSPTPPAAPSPAEGEIVVLLPETGAQRNLPAMRKAVLLCGGSMVLLCGVLYARKCLEQ